MEDILNPILMKLQKVNRRLDSLKQEQKELYLNLTKKCQKRLSGKILEYVDDKTEALNKRVHAYSTHTKTVSNTKYELSFFFVSNQSFKNKKTCKSYLTYSFQLVDFVRQAESSLYKLLFLLFPPSTTIDCSRKL